MKAYGITDKGLKREQNQDSYVIVEDEDVTFVAVCDGIGGHQAGDIASRLTCNLLSTCFKNQYNNNPEKWFRNALKRVNKLVYDESETNPHLKGMGTTLVAAVITKQATYILNVGDSRCYFMGTDGSFTQITEDHSLVNDLVKIEGMEPEKAEAVGRHIITKAVGIWPAVEGDVFELTDDYKYLMLCSDGLHDYVEQEDIINILNEEKSAPKKLEEMVDKSNEVGGFDNTTVVLVER